MKKGSSEKEIVFNMKIISRYPSLYIKVHPKVNASNEKEETISAYMVQQTECRLLTLYLLVSTKNSFGSRSGLDVSCKQFGSRSGPTHIGPDLDPNCLMLKVFMIFFVIFLKKATMKKIIRRHF